MDFDDILYHSYYDQGTPTQVPTNAYPNIHYQALLCVTDLLDYCESSYKLNGDWYYPDGHRIPDVDPEYRVRTFRTNRGDFEMLDNGQQIINGSVRLFRRFSPPERGRFRCELPSAANPIVNQTLYVNICEFIP